MDDCLTGKKTIPDRREKLLDWDVFSSMMLATWIRRFTLNNQNANKVANQWANIISRAFADGIYNHKEYVKAYRDTWGIKPSGGRVIDFVNFYPISMLCGCLDEHTEISLGDYVLN